VTTLPEYAYSALLDEITLVTHAEPDLGISLPDDEFQQKLRAAVGVASNADDKAFADALKTKLSQTGLTESEFRRMVRSNALQAKAFEKFTAELPATTQQAKFELIAAASEDDANKAIQRVKAGEAWDAVARDLSQETDVATTGGLQDFKPLEIIDPTYQNFVSTANPGDISQPLSDNGATPIFYVARLVERSDQPVQDSDKSLLATQQYTDWQTNTQASLSVFRDWDDQSQADALVWVRDTIVPRVIAARDAQLKTQIAAQSAAQTAQALQPTPGSPNATTTSAATPGAETPIAQPTVAATTAAGASPSVPQQPVAPGNGQ
jgi:parvulin-like peptidyl-prolyl isomerase